MSTGGNPKRKVQQPQCLPKLEIFMKRVQAVDVEIDEVSGELHEFLKHEQVLRDKLEQLDIDKRREVQKYLQALMRCGEAVAVEYVKQRKVDLAQESEAELKTGVKTEPEVTNEVTNEVKTEV